MGVLVSDGASATPRLGTRGGRGRFEKREGTGPSRRRERSSRPLWLGAAVRRGFGADESARLRILRMGLGVSAAAVRHVQAAPAAA